MCPPWVSDVGCDYITLELSRQRGQPAIAGCRYLHQSLSRDRTVELLPFVLGSCIRKARARDQDLLRHIGLDLSFIVSFNFKDSQVIRSLYVS